MKRIEQDIKQTKPFQSNYHKASINIMYTGKWLVNLHNDLFKTFGLSMQQYNTLRILNGIYPGHVPLMYIKERMLDKMSDASRIVSTLFKKGLVTRAPSITDRRKLDIVISQKGLNLVAKVEKHHYKLYELLSNLDDQEIKQLNFLLDKARA